MIRKLVGEFQLRVDNGQLKVPGRMHGTGKFSVLAGWMQITQNAHRCQDASAICAETFRMQRYERNREKNDKN